MRDEILFPRLHACAPGSAATLLAIRRNSGPLQVSLVAHRDSDLLVGDEILELKFLGLVLNDSAALIAVVFLDLLEFFDDDPAQFLFRCENALVLGDAV